MTETRPGRGRRGGGLPDDDDALDALSALANKALPPAAARPLAAVPPVQDPPPPAAQPAEAATPAAAPSPAQAAAAEQPRPVRSAPPVQDSDSDDEPAADGGTEDFIKQSTVQVDAQVVQRFRRYQDRERPKPSNAEVIFRALDAARGRYRDIIDVDLGGPPAAGWPPRSTSGRQWGRRPRSRSCRRNPAPTPCPRSSTRCSTSSCREEGRARRAPEQNARGSGLSSRTA
jgi:hypothetical protein